MIGEGHLNKTIYDIWYWDDFVETNYFKETRICDYRELWCGFAQKKKKSYDVDRLRKLNDWGGKTKNSPVFRQKPPTSWGCVLTKSSDVSLEPFVETNISWSLRCGINISVFGFCSFLLSCFVFVWIVIIIYIGMLYLIMFWLRLYFWLGLWTDLRRC